MNFPSLTYLLNVPGRLYDEERRELRILLGRVARLEKVEADANALIDCMAGAAMGDLPPVLDPAEADLWPGDLPWSYP